MFSINGKYVKLTRGDSFVADVSITRDGEPYIPESDDVITFSMKKSYYDEEDLITKQIDPEELQLSLEPSDTADLDFGEYVYDIDIVFPDGSKDTFIAEGILELTPEV